VASGYHENAYAPAPEGPSGLMEFEAFTELLSAELKDRASGKGASQEPVTFTVAGLHRGLVQRIIRQNYETDAAVAVPTPIYFSIGEKVSVPSISLTPSKKDLLST